MTAFFVQDVSLDTTDTIKLKLRQLYNPERMNRKTNIIVLPFSSVGKSKSCCFICKHKYTDLVMLSAKPRVTLFLQHNRLIPMGVLFCKHHLFSYLNSHIFKAAVVAQSVRAFAPQGVDWVFESQPRQT